MIVTSLGMEQRMYPLTMKELVTGALSLPDFSASDDEDTQKAVACEVMWKSNTQYGVWQDELICQGRG